MSEPKTTLGARAELAQCRSELAAARRRMATLETQIKQMQQPTPKHEPEVTIKKREIRIAPPVQGEMLYGTKAIAEFLGIRPRQALHLLEQDRLPHFHVGRVLCANRTTLRNWLSEMEKQGGR